MSKIQASHVEARNNGSELWTEETVVQKTHDAKFVPEKKIIINNL